jgi:hypothetical protein
MTAVVLTGTQKISELIEMEPDYVLSDISDLLSFIE